MIPSLYFVLALFLFIGTIYSQPIPECQDLLNGQIVCQEIEISSETFEAEGCRPNRTVAVDCYPISPQVICTGSRNFTRDMPCRYTNGFSFSTALSLSISLGLCGIDRCYLGYPTIGLFKFFTFGGFIIGSWLDMILISEQIVGPADGSDYIISPGGPRQSPLRVTNQTYRAR